MPKAIPISLLMRPNRTGQIAVIFASTRTKVDAEGYAEAAAAMEALARLQPGFCGMQSTRGTNGFGITVSYWDNDETARAWRDNEDHTRIREQGRAKWYSDYRLDVARIERNYDWQRDGE